MVLLPLLLLEDLVLQQLLRDPACQCYLWPLFDRQHPVVPYFPYFLPDQSDQLVQWPPCCRDPPFLLWPLNVPMFPGGLLHPEDLVAPEDPLLLCVQELRVHPVVQRLLLLRIILLVPRCLRLRQVRPDRKIPGDLRVP